MKEKNNNSSYLEALAKLRELIEESYPEGGWFPSSREVCEKYKFNRKTYQKALKCLELEGVAISYPKKGHYINPEFLRVQKIGIIIGNAEDSPFFQSDEILDSIFRVLRENKFNAQLIQAAELNNILDKALIHGVKGLIWLFPPTQVLPNIYKMSKASECPILVSSNANLNAIDNSDIVAVLPDSNKSRQTRADFFIKRKHKKVAIVAKSDIRDRIEKNFFPCFTKANVKAVFIPHDDNGKMADLALLSKDSNITGLMVDGGSRDIYSIFNALSQVKGHGIKDLYVHYTEKLDIIRSKFPRINITAVGHSNTGILGQNAALLLVDNILKAKPLASKKVDYFTLNTK